MALGDNEAVEAIKSDLLDILDRMDELGLGLAGAHLSMAIHCLEPDSFDCAQPAPPEDRGPGSEGRDRP